MFFMSCIVSLAVLGFSVQYLTNASEAISKSVIRLHVVADGNGVCEQKIKLKVRDEVIKLLSSYLEEAKTKKEAEKVIIANLDEIKKTAQKTLCENGTDALAEVYFNDFDFPNKKYADVVFPKGKYRALKIVIGSGKGENWWCVLFPQLCFSENTYGQLTKAGEEKLKSALTEDEYSLILSDTKIKFRALEFIDKIHR